MRVRRTGRDCGTVLFRRPGPRELRLLADALRAETVGGALLLGPRCWRSSWPTPRPATGRSIFRHYAIGPAALQLHLSLEAWAADRLLAIFFFIAGLELKRELVIGEMRHISAGSAMSSASRSAPWARRTRC